MKALKWVGIGVGGLVALGGIVVAVVFMLTAGAASAGNAFLALVGEGKYEEAYAAAAPQFREQTSLDRFRATMQRFGLDKFEAASWNSREISGGTATLDGTITTRNGGRVIAKMQLVKVGDTWKVHGMNLRPAGVG